MKKSPRFVTCSALSIMDSGTADATANMKRDYQILTRFLSNTSILHFYDWAEDSATYGCLLKPEKYLDLEKARSVGLDLAQRPTGGGIIFHLWDFAFSFLMPASHPKCSLNTLENYALVNEAVGKSIRDLTGERAPQLLPEDPVPLDEASRHFCMAKPTKYDVMLNGRKVGGAAQRRKKNGFLHQGSISLVPPDFDYLQEVLLPGTAVLEAMQHHTHALLPKTTTMQELLEAKHVLKKSLAKHLETALLA